MNENTIDLTVDAAEVERRLEKTALSINSIRRKFLNKIGLELKKEIRSQIAISYVPGSKHTGKMQKGIIYKISKNGGTYSFNDVEKMSVFPGRRVGTKALVQNAGVKIYSKKTGRFHHEIQGKAFVQKAQAVYINSGKYMSDVEKIVHIELAKVGLI